METTNISSTELLIKSKIHSNELNMDVVPYSIALQAITMEKTTSVLNDIEKHLLELSSMEKELKNILK